jgi:signal peptidase I
MLSLILIVAALITGVYWAFDALTKAGKRKQEKAKEPSMLIYARGTFLILCIILLIKVFNIGILPLLLVLTLASFLIWIIDKICFEKKRKAAKTKEPMLVDYARSLWWIFLVVLVIRSFIIQPFRVPTGSLEPTIMPNDFIVVSQYAYGLRLPVWHKKILNIGEPKRGDIVVFRSPSEPGIDFVKRTIGLPGDHIVYKNKTLYINGKEMKQTYLGDAVDIDQSNEGGGSPVSVMQENLNGVKHRIYLFKQGGMPAHFDFTVPKGYYFMMGDNRDNSSDSRVWGFMPQSAIIGKALMIFFSWDNGINWSRIGNKL